MTALRPVGPRKLGLSTMMFGARALVVSGLLAKYDAASYLRGLLIGSELADALAVFPQLGGDPIPLVGNGPLSLLYAAALSSVGLESVCVDSRDACLRGFVALDEACRG